MATKISASRHLALTGVLWFCIAFVVVHIIREDLEPWRRNLSLYAVGPAGWVLTLGFFSIALTQFLIALRLYRFKRSASDILSCLLLATAALGIVLVAVFPYTIKLPHNTGAALQLGLFPLFLLMRAFMHRDEPLWRFTAICAALSTSFFLLLVWNGETDYNIGTTAMAQKAEILVNTLWLLVYSWVWPAHQNR
jgi:hypothetical membrane protein